METYQLATGVGALCIKSMVCVNNKPVCITPQLFINHHLPSTSLPFFHGMAIVVTHLSPGDINYIIILSIRVSPIVQAISNYIPTMSPMRILVIHHYTYFLQWYTPPVLLPISIVEWLYIILHPLYRVHICIYNVIDGW